jgi:hypothetical protein
MPTPQVMATDDATKDQLSILGFGLFLTFGDEGPASGPDSPGHPSGCNAGSAFSSSNRRPDAMLRHGCNAWRKMS